jgi:hypothetical protein
MTIRIKLPDDGAFFASPGASTTGTLWYDASAGRLKYVTTSETITVSTTSDLSTISLDDLTDVSASSPIVGDTLRYDGTTWVTYNKSAYQEEVLDIVGGNVVAPGAGLPAAAKGQRYIVSGSPLHANWGTVTGYGSQDILEYNGTDWIVVYDISADSIGTIVLVDDENIFYRNSDGVDWQPFVPSSITDSDAIHDNVSGEIAALTEKVTPVAGDWVIIEDSATSNSKKKVDIGNLGGGLEEVGPVAVTAAGTSTIDSVVHASIRTAKWVVSIADSTAGDYASSEVLAVHDGTTVSYTEYAIIGTFTTYTLLVDISGADMRLRVTNNGANSINVTVARAEVSA